MRLFLTFASIAALTACGGSDTTSGEPVKIPEVQSEGRAESALAAPTEAKSDTSCRITTQDGNFEGSCTVETDGESTAIMMPEGDPLFGYVVSIGLFEFEEGKAEVRGLTTEGNNSRWGIAERSAEDASCWTGADFTICIS